MFYVYIIYSTKLDRYYVGYSIDLDKRMMDHNSGISKYTSKATDWELKYFGKFETRQEAMKREKYIKSQKSRKYIESLVNGLI